MLTERRRMERPLLWLVWISALMFSMVDGNFFYMGLLTLVTAMSYFATMRNMEICLDRWLVNFAAIAATVWIIAEHKIMGQRTIVSICHYTILIQICKIFERKRPFDYILTQLLAMILVVSSAMLCAFFWLAAMVVGYVFLACYVAMVFTLKRGLDRAAEHTLPGEYEHIDPKKLAWNSIRNWPGKPLRQVMFSLGCMSLFMGCLAFMLAPRTAKGILAVINSPEPLESMQEKTMSLGQSREIYLSRRQIMSVQIITNRHIGPAQSFSSQYLRENVLTKYSQSSWQTEDPGFMHINIPQIQNSRDYANLGIIVHRISLMPGFQGGLPAPYPTLSIEMPDSSKISVTRNLVYNDDDENTFTRRAYETYSFGEPMTQKQINIVMKFTNWSHTPRRPAAKINMSDNDKKLIIELAETWAGDLLRQRDALPEASRETMNIEIASRLAAKLDERCSYTLDLRDANPNRDAVVDFLFYMKKGHCEYFASTLGVMCCLLDVPARVAIGYHFDDYKRSSKSYIVRECDAHAWCEVYSNETNWTIVDPTPASAMASPNSDLQFWAKLKAKWMSLQYWWYENIIGFDATSQEHMKQDIQKTSENFFRHIGDIAAKLWNSIVLLISKGVIDAFLIKAFIWFLIVSLSLFVLKICQIIFFNMLMARTPEGQARMRRLKVLRHIVDITERKGLPYRPENTLREWSAQAIEQFNLPAAEMRQIVELHNRWRWGNIKPSPEEMEKILAAARIIENRIKSA